MPYPTLLSGSGAQARCAECVAFVERAELVPGVLLSLREVGVTGLRELPSQVPQALSPRLLTASSARGLRLPLLTRSVNIRHFEGR